MAQIFTEIEAIVNELTAQLNSAAVSPQLNALQSILLAFITLWVMAKGYMILAGKTDEPIKDLLFGAAIKAIIITVVFSPAWISLVTSSIDGLNEWASGSISLYTRMDELLSSAIKLSNNLIDADDGILDVPIVGTFSAVLVMFGFVVFSVFTILIVIGVTVTLKVLIMLTPIMIYTLLFDWFKQVFSKWLELVINNTLTVLLVGIFLNAFDGKYKSILDSKAAHGGSGDLIYIGTAILIVSLIMTWIVLMARGIAQQLTFVSIEHLPGSSAKDMASPYSKYKDWKFRRNLSK